MLTLMGSRKVLLEFEKGTDIVGSSMKIHGQHVWDGINVDICCLMALKPGLINMYYERAAAQKEKDEIACERDALKRERSEYEQR